MSISSIISNVSLSVDGLVVTERGTFLVQTGADSNTTITDQDSGQVWNVEPVDSVQFNVYRWLDGDVERTLTLGDVQRRKPTSGCGCSKKGAI